MIKKTFTLIALVSLFFSLFSCASNSVTKSEVVTSTVKSEKKSIITKNNNSLFWEITGKDKNGNQSTVYVLGTIHVGDSRLYPVPEFIESAYNNADRIVGELSTEAWEVMSLATNKMKKDSAEREAARIKETGKTLTDYLTEEEKKYLLNYVKSEDIINKYEPWFFYSELSEIPIKLSGLDSTKSYDIYFIEKSIKNERFIEGLDTIEEQLKTLSYGDWNTQLAMLKDTINNLITESDSAGNHILEIYKTYLNADEKKLGKIINSNIKNNNAEYSDDYYNSLFIEKNKSWAKKLEYYLTEGGTTFVFAGCGHFVGDDSVFNYME